MITIKQRLIKTLDLIFLILRYLQHLNIDITDVTQQLSDKKLLPNIPTRSNSITSDIFLSNANVIKNDLPSYNELVKFL